MVRRSSPFRPLRQLPRVGNESAHALGLRPRLREATAGRVCRRSLRRRLAQPEHRRGARAQAAAALVRLGRHRCAAVPLRRRVREARHHHRAPIGLDVGAFCARGGAAAVGAHARAVRARRGAMGRSQPHDGPLLHAVAIRHTPLGARCLCGRTLPAVARAATSTQHTAGAVARAERAAAATTSCATIPVTAARAAAASLAGSAARLFYRNARPYRRAVRCCRVRHARGRPRVRRPVAEAWWRGRRQSAGDEEEEKESDSPEAQRQGRGCHGRAAGEAPPRPCTRAGSAAGEDLARRSSGSSVRHSLAEALTAVFGGMEVDVY